MENQEQKLKSVDIEDNKICAEIDDEVEEIQPYATAYRIKVPIKYGDLRKKFNTFWKENKKALRKQFDIPDKKKGGKDSKEAQKALESNLGVEKLYHVLLCDYIIDKKPNVLFVEEIDIKNFEPGKITSVEAKIYEIPKVEMTGEINMDIDMSNFKVKDEDEAWKKRVEDLRQKYRDEVPHDGSLNENCNVVIDIISSKDGMPHPGLTITRKGIDIQSIIGTPAIKEAILSHKKGDRFEVTMKDEKESIIVSQIMIWDSFKVSFPEVNDELAKKDGFDSLDDMKETYITNIRNSVNELRKNYIVQRVCKSIINNMEFTSIPEPWINAKATATIQKHVKDFGSLEKAISTIGVIDEEQLVEMFRAQSMTELIQFMALKKYAELNDIHLVKNNMVVVADHMMENVRLVNAN